MNTKSKLFNLNSQIWSRGWCAQVDDRPEEEQGLRGEDQGAGGQAPGGGDGSGQRHQYLQRSRHRGDEAVRKHLEGFVVNAIVVDLLRTMRLYLIGLSISQVYLMGICVNPNNKIIVYLS